MWEGEEEQEGEEKEEGVIPAIRSRGLTTQLIQPVILGKARRTPLLFFKG